MRQQDAVTGLNCPACVLASLYSPRLHYVQTLVDREQVGRQVEQVVIERDNQSGKSKSNQRNVEKSTTYRNAFENDQTEAKIKACQERLDNLVARSQTLRQELEDIKEQVDLRRTQTQSQRKVLDQSRKALTVKHEDVLNLRGKELKERTRYHETVYRRLVSLSIRCCQQSLAFTRFRYTTTSLDVGKKLAQWHIWNFSIPDIRQLYGSEPGHVNAVFQQLAHLVHQLSTYLRVRLPAQISLPDLWHIYSPASSYVQREGSDSKRASPSQSRMGNMENSRLLEQRISGRPRHLYLEKALGKLVKDNSRSYLLFVEGVALLAWNVAWLCRTQGLPVAESKWEDVCDIGRNLWLLCGNSKLGDSPQNSRLRSDPNSAIKQARGSTAFSAPPRPSALGMYSHGSAKNFLPGPLPHNSGVYDVSAKWKFANPMMVTDELRSALLTEMSGHDWELLDDRDPEVEDNTDAEETVVIAGKQRPSSPQEKRTERRGEEKKGTSGWTKLKSRPQE